MPKRAKEMTALDVKRLSHPGEGRNVTFAVGGVSGLLLQITPTDAKSWILRYSIAGTKADKPAVLRREIGLGPYPDVPLAAARERAREAREKIYRGIDPYLEREASRVAVRASQARGLTFAKAVDKFLAGKRVEFGNAKHSDQWAMTLKEYACNIIGTKPVDELTVQDIQRALMQDTTDRKCNPCGELWIAKTETASRLRGRIESVLAWATVAGHRKGDNPARWKGNLDAILPKPGRVMKSDNQPALTLTDVSRWFADLRKRDGLGVRALEFLAQTAAP